MAPPPSLGVDGHASDALLSIGKFFTRWEESDDTLVYTIFGFKNRQPAA